MKVKADEFDGKVVYGEKKKEGGAGYVGHRNELAPTLATLTSLETQVLNRDRCCFILQFTSCSGSASLLDYILQMRGACLNRENNISS